MQNNIYDKLLQIIKKYHFDKCKFMYKINNEIIFYAKHKQKKSEIILFDTHKIKSFTINNDEIKFEKSVLLPIYTNKKKHTCSKESYLENKINIGSPKITFNIKSNKYKISLPVVFDRDCNFQKWNQELIRDSYINAGLDYGYYIFESVEYEL
jgi:hypothetical protein